MDSVPQDNRIKPNEHDRNNKKFVEDYIDRNGKMATIGGVPVPVVGGSWGEQRR